MHDKKRCGCHESLVTKGRIITDKNLDLSDESFSAGRVIGTSPLIVVSHNQLKLSMHVTE